MNREGELLLIKNASWVAVRVVETGISNGSSSWAQVFQGKRRCQWKSCEVTDNEIARLQAKFSEAIFFSDEKYEDICLHRRSCLVGKFLGASLSYDFFQKDLKIRWKVVKEFRVILISGGHLIF